ncbi:MAG: septum formation initiator family protein [Nocardioides sp.]|uniref:FtsB family cell division protein n=1 Tax=Nocardioides sp. TaxID=35761 RepID=UPI003F0DD9EF
MPSSSDARSPRRRTSGDSRGPSTRPGARPAQSGRRTGSAENLEETAAWTGPLTAVGRSGASADERSRARPTGRLGILLLVVAVLVVSYASSLRAYLVQRDHIASTKAEIAERQSRISALEREKQRWEDPAYVQAQATKLGYVKIGEVGFLVLDEDGSPLESEVELSDPDDVLRTTPTPWWSKAWASMESAGDPPTEAEKLQTDKIIDGTKK